MTAELSVDATGAAASEARALVARELADAPDGVVDAARLDVTELVTNAVLHGLPPVVVRLRRDDEHVRVEVEDHGRRMPLRMRPSSGSLTGRGLGLVAALAASWGAEPLPEGGKVVWVDLVDGQDDGDEAPSADLDDLLEAWPDEPAVEPVVPVELGDVPTDLLLAAKSHVDNLLREFALRSGDPSSPLVDALEHVVMTVTREFAGARQQIKRQAVEAAERGDAVTQLRLLLPASAADGAERYLDALDEADRYAREAQLLTLETPHAHRVFRRWYVTSLATQLRAAAAGEPAPVVPTLVQHLVEEVSALAESRHEAQRMELLQRVTAALAGATSAEEICDTVVAQATGVLGAHASRLYLLHEERTLRCVARSGGEPASVYEEVPLDDSLPGGRALLTGEHVIARNRAHLTRQFPVLADLYLEERTLLVAPLLAGDRRLGVLSLSFLEASDVDERTQTAFLSTLAGVTAQAIDRVTTGHASPAAPPQRDAATLD